MHFVFRDPGHLPHVLECAFKFTYACRLIPVRRHIEYTCDQGSQLAQDPQATMCPLGKVDGFLRTKQPFNETVKLLTPDQC